MIRRKPGAGPDSACLGCLEGDVWYGPGGNELRFCGAHEWLVTDRPEWRRAGVQATDQDDAVR